jgi:hypothetical protein
MKPMVLSKDESVGQPAEGEASADREYIAGLEKGMAVLELFSSRCPKLTPMAAGQLTDAFAPSRNWVTCASTASNTR